MCLYMNVSMDWRVKGIEAYHDAEKTRGSLTASLLIAGTGDSAAEFGPDLCDRGGPMTYDLQPGLSY